MAVSLAYSYVAGSLVCERFVQDKDKTHAGRQRSRYWLAGHRCRAVMKYLANYYGYRLITLHSWKPPRGAARIQPGPFVIQGRKGSRQA